MRRSLVALIALVGLATGVAPVRPPDAHAQAAPPPAAAGRAAPVMTLASQTPWATPESSAVLELHFRARVPGYSVRMTVRRAVVSRTAFTQSLAGRALGAAEGRIEIPVAELPEGAPGNRLLAVGIQGPGAPSDAARIVPGRSGVYPLEVELRRQGKTVDRFVTPLVVIAPGLVPLTFAWVWRFDATPAHSPDGNLRPAAARAIRPGGRLWRMAGALATAGDAHVTLAPVPETMEAWADPAAGPDAANRLADLQTAAAQPTRQVLAAPFVPLDIPALVSDDLGPEVDDQFARGAEVLGDVFWAPPSPNTMMVGGSLDPAALNRLHQYGTRRLVVAPSALEPVDQRLTPGHPFALGGRGRMLTAAVNDTDLGNLLGGDDPPGLRAARFLAGLSLVALEAPRDRRGVVVVTPEQWDPPAELLEAVLRGLRRHPAVVPATLDEYFAQVPPETREGQPVIRDVARRQAAEPAVTDGIQAARRRLDAFAALVGQGHPRLQAADRAILTSEAAALAARDRSDRKLAPPSHYVRAANRVVREVLGRVRGPDGQRVTLTARRASIPISLLNANPKPLQVRVRLESDQLRFPGGADRVLILPPQNTTERFAVEARSSGAFPLVITVTSPDGRLLVNRSELIVRSTVVSGVGALLTAGAGVFLLVWWGNNLRSSGRQRRIGRRARRQGRLAARAAAEAADEAAALG